MNFFSFDFLKCKRKIKIDLFFIYMWTDLGIESTPYEKSNCIALHCIASYRNQSYRNWYVYSEVLCVFFFFFYNHRLFFVWEKKWNREKKRSIFSVYLLCISWCTFLKYILLCICLHQIHLLLDLSRSLTHSLYILFFFCVCFYALIFVFSYNISSVTCFEFFFIFYSAFSSHAQQ